MTFILIPGNDGTMKNNTGNKTVMKNRKNRRNCPFNNNHLFK